MPIKKTPVKKAPAQKTPAKKPREAKPQLLTIVCDPLDEGRRLDQLIAARSGEVVGSRNVAKKLILEGAVSLNGELCADADRKMKPGDTVVVCRDKPEPVKMLGEKIPYGVVFEDDDLLVVDKPAGLVVHPGAGNRKGTLVNALVGSRVRLSSVGGGDRPGIVHRLDKDTSGLIVIAKTNRAHRLLVKAFSSREVHKEYVAIVDGRVDRVEGRIDRPVGRDRLQRTKMTAVDPEHAREALTNYKVEERFKHSTLVRLQPTTGRTHQIRVHMASLGHPVLGDEVYGTPDGTRLALHAHRISFDHPVTKKTVAFESPLPDDFRRRLKHERAESAGKK